MEIFMRMILIFTMLLNGCGSSGGDNLPCTSEDCGPGPRLKLTAQDSFGHIQCTGDASDCVLDFGVLSPGLSAESWTDMENVGDATLRLSALLVTDPIFEVRHPAVELEPGEVLSFRIRVRLDAANQAQEAELYFDSDAVNGAAVESGCPEGAYGCGRITVKLRARSDS
jgi:hypothetical protein